MRTSLINDPWVHTYTCIGCEIFAPCRRRSTLLRKFNHRHCRWWGWMIRERKSNLFVFIDFSFLTLARTSDLRERPSRWDENEIGNQTENLFSEHVRFFSRMPTQIDRMCARTPTHWTCLMSSVWLRLFLAGFILVEQMIPRKRRKKETTYQGVQEASGEIRK